MPRIEISDSSKNVGIYVISDDDSLLRNINRIMKRKGVIGVTDTVGRMNYFVDARKGRSVETQEHLNSVMFKQVNVTNKYDSVINRVLLSHGFNLSLIGCSIMVYIIRNCIADNDTSHTNLKYIAIEAADVFNMSPNTVKRDIRYAVKNSDYANSGFRTSLIIFSLAEEVKKLYEKDLDRL